jgi:hypothetical protein
LQFLVLVLTERGGRRPVGGETVDLEPQLTLQFCHHLTADVLLCRDNPNVGSLVIATNVNIPDVLNRSVVKIGLSWVSLLVYLLL